MLPRQSMARMTAQKSGRCAAIATMNLLKHGMVVCLSRLIMQSAQQLSSGLETLHGSRKCGKENLTEWYPIYNRKGLKTHLTKIENGNVKGDAPIPDAPPFVVK